MFSLALASLCIGILGRERAGVVSSALLNSNHQPGTDEIASRPAVAGLLQVRGADRVSEAGPLARSCVGSDLETHQGPVVERRGFNERPRLYRRRTDIAGTCAVGARLSVESLTTSQRVLGGWKPSAASGLAG